MTAVTHAEQSHLASLVEAWWTAYLDYQAMQNALAAAYGYRWRGDPLRDAVRAFVSAKERLQHYEALLADAVGE